MTPRAGLTINGIHFAKTTARRLYSARTMYFIDGKPVTQAAWVAAYKAAEAAESKGA
jgi:hypothetical protein